MQPKIITYQGLDRSNKTRVRIGPNPFGIEFLVIKNTYCCLFQQIKSWQFCDQYSVLFGCFRDKILCKLFSVMLYCSAVSAHFMSPECAFFYDFQPNKTEGGDPSLIWGGGLGVFHLEKLPRAAQTFKPLDSFFIDTVPVSSLRENYNQMIQKYFKTIKLKL